MLKLSLIFLSSLICAQTKINESQIVTPVVQAPSLRIVKPNGQVVYAELSVDDWVIDESSGKPIIRLASPSPFTDLKLAKLISNTEGVYTLPTDSFGIIVFRNGLAHDPVFDFTIISGTKSFKFNNPLLPTDLIMVMYVQKRVPSLTITNTTK
jgi:hypothetical protein